MRDSPRRVILVVAIVVTVAIVAIAVPAAVALVGTSTALIPAISTSPYPKLFVQKAFTGLSQPVGLTHADDGTGRIFIVEKTGRIRLVKGGVLQPTPFLDIRDLVSGGGEQGLLGIAFPPDHETTGRFYIDYTDRTGDTRIARLSISANPDVADRATLTTLLRIDQPYANHNGGQIAFGPDGYLYIGMGDGGGGGDPNNSAQNKASLLGKMLRVDVSGATYTVPASNPFVGAPGWRSEIWALGLRNPWRFSFDTSTGDMWIGDVGQNKYEEIDFQPAASTGGENYGWSRYEGYHSYNTARALTTTYAATPPVDEYSHPFGESVTGGYVHRGAADPGLNGFYYYADFETGMIFAMRREAPALARRTLLDTPYLITSFGEDEAGALYVCDYGGTIYRLRDPAAVRAEDPTEEDIDAAGSSDVLMQYDYGNGATAGWALISAGTQFYGPSRQWTTPAGTVTFASRRLALGDVDADGDADGLELVNTALGYHIDRYISNAATMAPVRAASGIGMMPVRGTFMAGDYSGDSRADAMDAYRYDTRAFYITGVPSGASTAAVLWQGPTPGDTASFAAGDFDGDGACDVIGVFATGPTSAQIVGFRSNGATMTAATLWTGGANSLVVSRCRVGVGDVDADGDDDFLIHYDYGSGTSGILAFLSDGAAVAPRTMWRSGPGGFTWSRCKMTVADVSGDTRADVVLAYDYGSSTTGLWGFRSTGTAMTPLFMWRSASGGWAWSRSRLAP